MDLIDSDDEVVPKKIVQPPNSVKAHRFPAFANKEDIWYNSHFGRVPPLTNNTCAFAQCHNLAGVKKLVAQCEKCKIARFCGSKCRKLAVDTHGFFCTGSLPDARLALATFINHAEMRDMIKYADDVFDAGIESTLASINFLPSEQEFFNLTQEEDESVEAFSDRRMRALMERVRIAFIRRRKGKGGPPLLTTESTESWTGISLFTILCAGFVGSQFANFNVSLLVASMQSYAIAPEPGFHFFALDPGHVAPACTDTDDLTLSELYSSDLTAGGSTMCCLYLLTLVPVIPAAGIAISAVLWRVGQSNTIIAALPGLHSVADYLKKADSRLDQDSYASSVMSQGTVLTRYLPDLMLLTDASQSDKVRRRAFCRVFALKGKSFDVKRFAKGEELPVYSLLAARAFMY
jgi:hypothetical protein